MTTKNTTLYFPDIMPANAGIQGPPAASVNRDFWTPAFEDVIQLAREKTVANFCSTAAVMDAFAQPLVRKFQTYPADLSTKFGKSFDLLQPSFGKANGITSSCAGVTRGKRPVPDLERGEA